MFLPVKVNKSGIEPWERLPCSAIQPKLGQAMYLSGGQLAVAGGTTTPQYICMEERDAAVAAGTPIHVLPIREGMIFETIAAAALTSVNIGDKVTLMTSGIAVTATTTGGVATIVEMDGTAANSTVRVCFD